MAALALLRHDKKKALQQVKHLVKVNKDLAQCVLTTDVDGWTPVHACALRGSKKLLKTMLQSGVDVNCIMGRPEGLPGQCTLLHIAANREDKKVVWVVQYLLHHGADVHRTDSDGHTPITYARLAGNTDTVRLLLNRGAKMEVENKGRLLRHQSSHLQQQQQQQHFPHHHQRPLHLKLQHLPHHFQHPPQRPDCLWQHRCGSSRQQQHQQQVKHDSHNRHHHHPDQQQQQQHLSRPSPHQLSCRSQQDSKPRPEYEEGGEPKLSGLNHGSVQQKQIGQQHIEQQQQKELQTPHHHHHHHHHSKQQQQQQQQQWQQQQQQQQSRLQHNPRPSPGQKQRDPSKSVPATPSTPDGVSTPSTGPPRTPPPRPRAAGVITSLRHCTRHERCASSPCLLASSSPALRCGDSDDSLAGNGRSRLPSAASKTSNSNNNNNSTSNSNGSSSSGGGGGGAILVSTPRVLVTTEGYRNTAV